MKHIVITFILFIFSQFVLAESNSNWRNISTDEINKLLVSASKFDDDPQLSLSEVVKVFGKYDVVETMNLMIPDNQVWQRIDNRDMAIQTYEPAWKLSKDRKLQVVVVGSIIVFAFIVEKNNKRSLVWK